MSEFHPWLYSAMALSGVALSALCAGVETGVYTINRVRLALRVGRGERRALILRDELDHPNRLLATLLVVNTVGTDIGSAGIAHVFDKFGFGPVEAIAINTAILVPLLFIFGEVLPKDLFRSLTDRWTLGTAPLIRGARLVLTAMGVVPLVNWIGNIILRRIGTPAESAVTSRQRLVRLFEEGAGAGVLSEQQVTLAERAMGVTGRLVAERMVPWRRIETMRTSVDARGRELKMRSHPFSRYPVVDESGRVTGIVSALDLLLSRERSITDLRSPACWVPAGASLLEALEALRRARTKVALVGKPGDVPVGMVTMTDLLEPLVGTFAGDL